MTNPEDPRTPQERAYSLDEPGDDDARVLYTDDPTEAYGRPAANPTLVYPQYDPRFDPSAPPPGDTRPLGDPYAPTPHHPQYAPTQQFGTPGPYQQQPQYAPQQYGPPGAPPAGPGQGDGPGGSRGPRWGLLALLAAGIVAFGAVVGLLLGTVGSGDDATVAAPTTTTAAPAPTTTRPPATTQPSLPTMPLDPLPGRVAEELAASGMVVGTVTANDGTSITVSAIGGSLVTVQITEATRIMTRNDDVSDIEAGATAVVYGSPVENGRMTADRIVSASLPSFGGPGTGPR
ncbi:DUF5666 domain-containing protein [Rhodococcus yananensis]|uniref:DUF5666 domain-containing protein n=1 Tax=Rhodococcus yananensis TaxID=2879464 RepID=UPI001CF83B47|nr:DUF5666 domain-containing protein [Rhodococcus yananensis]